MANVLPLIRAFRRNCLFTAVNKSIDGVEPLVLSGGLHHDICELLNRRLDPLGSQRYATSQLDFFAKESAHTSLAGVCMC